MKISLITATLGRVNELDVLLASLEAQTYKNFELIIIDQNEHFDVKSIVAKYTQKLDIQYIRSNTKGLSYNRNIGIKKCTGNILGFPDDDCYYQNDVLMSVIDVFEKDNIKFCALPVFDTICKENCYMFKQESMINRSHVHKYCISFNFFIKNPLYNYFDERLGVGTYFSSGEETDYLFANISCQDEGMFIHKSGIHHLNNDQHLSVDRAYKYALGFGALYKKEIFQRHNYFYIFRYFYYLLRSLGGCIIHPSKFIFYKNILKGRMLGFIQFKIEK